MMLSSKRITVCTTERENKVICDHVCFSEQISRHQEAHKSNNELIVNKKSEGMKTHILILRKKSRMIEANAIEIYNQIPSRKKPNMAYCLY
jgi:hypothetical protein